MGYTVYYIYLIVFPNSKFYIGKSKNPEKRFKEHKYLSKKRNKTLVQKALTKYDNEVFYLLIDSSLNEEEIYIKEQFWIDYFKSNQRNFGYNLTSGGERGPTWNELQESVKQKLSIERSIYMKEHNHSKVNNLEIKEKISKSLKKYMNSLNEEEKLQRGKNISTGHSTFWNSPEGQIRKELLRQQKSGKNNPMSKENIEKRKNST